MDHSPSQTLPHWAEGFPPLKHHPLGGQGVSTLSRRLRCLPSLFEKSATTLLGVRKQT